MVRFGILAFIPAFLIAAAVSDLHAQPYPSRPIRFIVPFAPGGTNDIVARLVATKFTEAWGQPVIVDNRGGASGVIGTELTAKATPDGYTLLMANVNLATNPSLVKKLPYDTLRDLSPVALIATSPTVLVVHPALPVQSVAELIKHAKSNPGKLNYSTSGAGSTTHIAMELLISMTGIKIAPVHYKGGGPALIDLLGGRVSQGFATILSVMPHIKAQRVRALAVSTPKRSAALPEVPTVDESGVPGYAFTGWWGMVVPTGTAPATIMKLNRELETTLAQPGVKQILIGQGAEPEHTSPDGFGAYIRAEIAKWSDVIRQARIEAQ
ncbi:MAG: tripartite tricarboxylate transporter substrate binding protein [Burkholderiales bacterium]|nr:tripartite tricarboxylate transporter substrate binding protein [Burkholderiales bacterium]